jgi:hypothetical protein
MDTLRDVWRKFVDFLKKTWKKIKSWLPSLGKNIDKLLASFKELKTNDTNKESFELTTSNIVRIFASDTVVDANHGQTILNNLNSTLVAITQSEKKAKLETLYKKWFEKGKINKINENEITSIETELKDFVKNLVDGIVPAIQKKTLSAGINFEPLAENKGLFVGASAVGSSIGLQDYYEKTTDTAKSLKPQEADVMKKLAVTLLGNAKMVLDNQKSYLEDINKSTDVINAVIDVGESGIVAGQKIADVINDEPSSNNSIIIGNIKALLGFSRSTTAAVNKAYTVSSY